MAKNRPSKEELIHTAYAELMWEIVLLKEDLLSDNFSDARNDILHLINQQLDVDSETANKLCIRFMLMIDPDHR